MKRLKELRETKSLTQSELATKSGLSKNTICNYENGHRNPKISDLKKIAAVLDCDVPDLLD